MGRKKLPYKEGDWIAIPLKNSGYAIGLIARPQRKGRILLGYFFGPKHEQIPNLEELQDLKPEDASLIAIFGDLGLYTGQWPVIGQIPPWNRSKWPMPPFIRTDCISGKTSRIEYSEDDLTCEIRATPCGSEEAKRYPQDGLWGSGAVEIRLTKLLTS